MSALPPASTTLQGNTSDVGALLARKANQSRGDAAPLKEAEAPTISLADDGWDPSEVLGRLPARKRAPTPPKDEQVLERAPTPVHQPKATTPIKIGHGPSTGASLAAGILGNL